MAYSSFRDPTPEESINVFLASYKFLREFAESGADLNKYVIGAMGEFEPYLSAPSKAAVSTARYLSGYDEEKRARLRNEILSTNTASLLGVADAFSKLSETLCSLIVAPKEKITAEEILYV